MTEEELKNNEEGIKNIMGFIDLKWFFAAIFGSILFSFVGIFQKWGIAEDEAGPVAYSILLQFAAGLVALPFAIFEIKNLPINIHAWIIILVSGVVCAGANVFYLYALKQTEVSQINIISSTTSLWVLIGGIIFYGESFSPKKIISVLLIVFAIIIVYWGKNSFRGFGMPQIFTLIFAAAFGITELLDKYLLNYFSIASYLLLIFWIPSILTAIVRPSAVKSIIQVLKLNKKVIFVLISAVFVSLSNFLMFYSLKLGGEVSIVAPIWNSSTVLAVLFSIVFLKERELMKRKVIAAVIAFVGVLLIR